MKKILIFLYLSLATTVAMSKNPTEFVVAHAPGGVSDITVRTVAKGLPAGKYVVINKPGGASQIGINHIMQRPGMLLATSTQVFVSNLFIFKDLSYNPDKDLENIATVGMIPSVLACNRNTGIKNVKDLINTYKPLAFGTGAYGTNTHLVTELLFTKTKTRQQVIPYPAGGNPHIVAMIGGHVDCVFANLPDIKPFVDNPNLVLLLASHSDLGLNVRSWEQEFAQPFPLQTYLLVVVPSNMDSALKQDIKNDLAQSFKNSEVVTGLKNSGLFVNASTDAKDINRAVEANLSARKFIKTNKINLQGN